MGDFGSLTPFKHETLTETVVKFKNVQHRGQEIFRRKKQITGMTAKWDVVSNTRRIGKANVFGAASLPSPLLARTQNSAQCIYFNEHIVITPDDMMMRQPGTLDQSAIENLAASFAPDLEGLNTRLENLMEWARWQVVTTHGITYAGASENAGAPIISADSTDFGVPAANSTTPTVLWTATATATPWSDLAGWQQTAAFASNLDPGPAWMNRDTNQMIVDILIERGGGTNSGINVHEGARRQALDEGKVTRLNGVDIEIYNGTYVNDSGTVTTWIPTGIVAFAPPEAVRWIEGSQPVPTGNAQDLSDIVNGFGKQSWSIVEQDPVGVKVILSCPFFPAVEIPEALFIADVN